MRTFFNLNARYFLGLCLVACVAFSNFSYANPKAAAKTGFNVAWSTTYYHRNYYPRGYYHRNVYPGYRPYPNRYIHKPYRRVCNKQCVRGPRGVTCRKVCY
ncbi:MAG TPA: hypothetical protein DCG13_06170 [Legionellales bacterium]|nr:hypothetical protein [Legionellales bacterium]